MALLDTSPVSTIIALVDAAELLLAEGDLTLDASTQATLDMNGSTSPNFSLFQRNALGIKVVRAIRWMKRNPGAVAFISGVTY